MKAVTHWFALAAEFAFIAMALGGVMTLAIAVARCAP